MPEIQLAIPLAAGETSCEAEALVGDADAWLLLPLAWFS
jgi:hypothetical protein